ncbi:putative AfsR family transcriptional regulator [Streptomyces sp. NBRC 110611]|uniref:AfsR/SARP family transcriptional regulator n=1 Tax=Streptomyces sp. NBRC 110611 TaxID=1621259 RepID=UPI000858F3B3|nr:AfsR/SARP family transcriptional regulator [Streptomyces sp. NBRC 110611]GAU65809.1 putative AfsR family transcriptional regulator [Streptomyces sp. NBRC 110611]
MSQLLGLLLVQNGETVGVDTLIEELWGENVPRSSLTTLQTYIYHARKIFAALPDGQAVLVTRPAGYVIQVPGEAIDAVVFERLVQQARRLLDDGRPEAALKRLDEALRLWRGPVLVGMMLGSVLNAHITYINELRFAATELRIEASQRLGRHQEIIPQLRLLVAENPLNERLHAQLITSLHKCGRRAEALQAYRSLWRTLDMELGVEPAPELQLLQHEMLSRASPVPGPR